jgi:hypothetical protein
MNVPITLIGIAIAMINVDVKLRRKKNMRVGKKLVDIVNRRGGDLGSGKDFHVLLERPCRDKSRDRRLAFLGEPHPVTV